MKLVEVGKTYKFYYRLPGTKKERTITAKVIGLRDAIIITLSGRQQKPDFGTCELLSSWLTRVEEVK